MGNFNHPCKEIVWVAQPDANVDYCESLNPTTDVSLYNLLGAQPFNYSDAVDVLPNSVKAFDADDSFIDTNVTGGAFDDDYADGAAGSSNVGPWFFRSLRDCSRHALLGREPCCHRQTSAQWPGPLLGARGHLLRPRPTLPIPHPCSGYWHQRLLVCPSS